MYNTSNFRNSRHVTSNHIITIEISSVRGKYYLLTIENKMCSVNWEIFHKYALKVCICLPVYLKVENITERSIMEKEQRKGANDV